MHVSMHAFGKPVGCLCLLVKNYYLSVDFSTSSLHLATTPAMTPKAASHGARVTIATAPAAPHVTGIESSSLPLSSLTVILLTRASLIISLTLPTNPSPETRYTSFLSPAWVPQFGQNLASGGRFDLHSRHFSILMLNNLMRK